LLPFGVRFCRKLPDNPNGLVKQCVLVVSGCQFESTCGLFDIGFCSTGRERPKPNFDPLVDELAVFTPVHNKRERESGSETRRIRALGPASSKLDRTSGLDERIKASLSPIQKP
jgi:hypothetical protein